MKTFDNTSALKPLSITMLSLFAFSLSACSHQRELSPFKRDYNSHAYSAYVQDNLKKPTVTSLNLAKQQAAKTAHNNRQLKAVQRQLTAKQTRFNNKIANTIQQNNLFTPSPALQREADEINNTNKTNETNKKQAYENWLQKQSNLPTALTIALNNNLDIQSRLQEAKASLAKYDQVSFLDDTLAQYAAFTKDLNVPIGKQKQNPSVADNFPFSGLLTLKASIIDQAVESSRLQLKQTVQDTLTQTRIAYYELQLARQVIGILNEKIALLQSLKQQLEMSYSTSTTTLNSILQVDIDIDKTRNKRQTSQNNVTIQQARLNALLNLSPQFSLGKTKRIRPIKITVNTQELLQTGKQNRVEIARLQSELKKMERIISLSEKRFYPDFSAGYSRFQNQTSQQTGSNASKATFSTRPQFKKRNFFGSNDAYLNETTIKYKALQSKLRALMNKTEEDIQQTLSSYNTQKSNRRLYQSKVIPQAKITLESAKGLFATGEASYVEVINIQKQILDYRLLSLTAIKGMNVNTAKLSRFVGQSL